MSTAMALDPRRDPFGGTEEEASGQQRDNKHNEHDGAYQALTEQLDVNANTFSMKLGPSFAFHNHAAALLTSMYRLGATPDELRSALKNTPELGGLKKLEEAANDNTNNGDDEQLVVNASNWEEYLGGYGLYGLGAHAKIPAYQTFFEHEIDAKGPETTILKYLPELAKGCVGDFFHALIELGYYFESNRHSTLLPVSLAWLASSYVELPALNSSGNSNGGDDGTTKFDSPLVALEALSKDKYSFPTFDLNDGSSGYIAAMEDLAKDHCDAVLKYELTKIDDDNMSNGRELRDARLEQICCAAAESFSAGGYCDFYLLHLVTGSRAIWSIIQSLGRRLSENILDPAVEDDLIEIFWRAMLYTHVSRNRPHSSRQQGSPNNDATTDSTNKLRPWSEITRHGLQSQNSHVTKCIMNCADFYDKWNDVRFWNTANGIVTAREELGQKLVGTGVGSKIDRFLKQEQ